MENLAIRTDEKITWLRGKTNRMICKGCWSGPIGETIIYKADPDTLRCPKCGERVEFS